MAERWSQALAAEHGEDTTALVSAAWQAAFTRPPSESEIEAAKNFLQSQTATLAAKQPDGPPPPAAALVDFCHAILNANEFLYVD